MGTKKPFPIFAPNDYTGPLSSPAPFPLLRFLYDCSIRAFQVALPLLARFNPKARQLRAGRRSIAEHLARWQAARPAGAPVAWMHCASLGEFEQGRPVLEAFRRQYPDWQLVLTFFSPSGYQIRKDYPGADCVTYLPADTPANARWFVEAVSPSLVFWVKYEFWYHHLRVLHDRRVPTVLISALFRPDQLFFKPYGGFYRTLLGYFDYLFVQNPESLDLLRGIGVTNVELGGDTRFDRVAEIAAQRPRYPLIEAFKGEADLFVVGSMWEEDWKVIANCGWRMANFFEPESLAIRHSPSAIRLLIAPHEISPAQIERWQRELGVPSVRYSEATPESVRAARVLFLDTIGMLSAVYDYADYAFIGGAYREGLHNVLEAAVFGMPIFFGNRRYQNFQEARDLLSLGVAFAVADEDELERVFSELRADEPRRRELAARAAAYVQERTGATERVMAWVQK